MENFDIAGYIMNSSLCVVSLDQLTLQFNDTEKLQILDELKHLGVTHIVYPGAVHSRVEHALDVYHLSEETVNQLERYQGSELGIDDFQVQTVNLAGLLHDVGHGSFKAESGFLSKSLQGSSERSHEDMSVRLIDYIVDKCHIEIDALMQKQLKELAVSSIVRALRDSLKEKQFLDDDVADCENGIDDNKLQQTVRVVDDEIFHHTEECLTINKLFLSRADLHRTVVNTHAKVKAIELSDVDALLKASSVNDPAQFWKLDEIEPDTHPELKEARDLILQIKRRVLYQFCNEFTVPKERLEPFKNLTPQQICSQDFVPVKESYCQVFIEQGGSSRLIKIDKIDKNIKESY